MQNEMIRRESNKTTVYTLRVLKLSWDIKYFFSIWSVIYMFTLLTAIQTSVN